MANGTAGEFSIQSGARRRADDGMSSERDASRAMATDGGSSNMSAGVSGGPPPMKEATMGTTSSASHDVGDVVAIQNVLEGEGIDHFVVGAGALSVLPGAVPGKSDDQRRSSRGGNPHLERTRFGVHPCELGQGWRIRSGPFRSVDPQIPNLAIASEREGPISKA